MKLFDIFTPSEPDNNHQGMTNQDLVNRICAEFESKLTDASTEDKVLFPMSFTILLHPNNYDNVSYYFAAVTQSIVKRFYKIIEKYSGSSLSNKIANRLNLNFLSNNKSVVAIGNNWEFILSKTTVGKVGNFQVGIDNPGFIISPTARVYGENLNKQSSVKLSVSCLNSNPSESQDINLDALTGINLIGDNHYLIAFNKSLCYKEQDVESNQANNDYGTLFFRYNGNDYTFTIKDELVSISGTEDKREQRNIFKLPCSELQNDHVQIKYDKASGTYYISTIASDTRVNQKVLQQSTGSPFWSILPNNSEIFMIGRYSVKFKK